MAQSQAESLDCNEQLNRFFIEHEKKAYTLAFMSLKNQDDALDVLQDVMIKFVEKYKHKQYQVWAPLFYRMVQNRITDFHRKKTQKNKYFSFFSNEDENHIENIADENLPTIISMIDSHMKINNLQNALETLSTRQLQAFMCRIWEGLSVSQTAQSMKCSQGSVKTHLFRAVKQLKLYLHSANEDEVNSNGQ
jgi:RNA polymerase sigma-70 factor (ECF subfamily)